MNERSTPPAAKVPILLVDDQRTNLLALQAILTSEDYELVAVRSGREALREIERRSFAVVLLDVMMPDMDGFETAFAMRQTGRAAPIVFVTAMDTPPSRVLQAYAGGAVDFLQKPVDPMVLRSKVAVFAELYRVRAFLAAERAGRTQDAESFRADALAADEKANSDSLRISDAHFRVLADTMPILAWYADPDGYIPWFNRRWFEYTGTTLADQDGWKWQSVLDPADLARVTAKWKAALERGEPWEDEFRLRRRDGQLRWFLCRAAPFRDAHGRITRWFGTSVDVDDQKRAEEKIRAERERLLALLKQVPAIVNFLRGPDLVFDFAHPKAMEAMGCQSALGKPLLVACPAMRDEPYYERVRRVYETGEPFSQHEGRGWYASEGRETYWDSVYLPVRDATGVIEGVMTFDFDVTATVYARRELERVNRAKDEFLATMSHELRTPLNAIYGWATMLRKKPRDDAQLERGLEVIERNASAQTRLVGDLLDVSRIVSGKLTLKLKPSDVEPLVLAAVDVVRAAADSKGIRLVVEVDPDLGASVVDPDRIQQIVWNLLINAVKFTPRGGSILVTSRRDQSAIVLRVRDSGAGIEPKHLPYIFDRFTQVDSSTTRAHGGLGLGLAIVRHLVEAHGGQVEAESPGLGEGATFTVTLPIRAIHVEPVHVEATTEEVGPASDESTTTLRNVRVLVVEDDGDSLELMRMVLEKAGADVTTAASAREALGWIEAHPRVDVIISDIGMPEMDGYAFIQAVRASPLGSNVPAIALTAYAGKPESERARSAGYQEYFAKPVDAARLLRAVDKWSRERPVHPAT